MRFIFDLIGYFPRIAVGLVYCYWAFGIWQSATGQTKFFLALGGAVLFQALKPDPVKKLEKEKLRSRGLIACRACGGRGTVVSTLGQSDASDWQRRLGKSVPDWTPDPNVRNTCTKCLGFGTVSIRKHRTRQIFKLMVLVALIWWFISSYGTPPAIGGV